MVLQGYWMDIGQPHDYLKGMQLHLDSLRKQGKLNSAEDESHFTVIEPVLIDPTAMIEPGAVIGPYVVIGPQCRVS